MSRPPLSRPAPPAAPSTAALAASPPRSKAGLGAVLEASPLLLPAALAGFSLVAMALLQLGEFRPLLVLPLGLAVAAVAAYGVGLRRPEPLDGPRWLDGAALAVSAAFAAVNAPFTAQNLKVFRDPATYTLTGQWLEHHDSLPIPVHPEVFGRGAGVGFYSLGFDAATTPGFVHSQFSNLVPGLLAVGGWLGDDRLLLRVNVVLGAGALLAFYGLARQHTGRAWALVAMAALAVSLPLLYFTRNPYSEPVTLLFITGGLALLAEALRRDRAWAYGLAGLVLGSGTLARVDGFFYLVGVTVFAAVALAAAPAGRRRRVAGRVAALVGGAAVPTAVAVANLVNLSPRYLHDHFGEVRLSVAAIAAVAVAGAVAVVLAWRTRLLHRVAAATGRWLPAAGAAAVLVLGAAGASRPLWYVGRIRNPEPGQPAYIEFLQRAGGQAVNGMRSYAEQTIAWLSWYWGPVTVALGLLGVAAGVYRLLRRGELRLVAPLAVFIPAALLYLNLPATPDQINAMRRFLPVVVPGMLLAAAVVLGLLARRSRATLAVAAVLAAAMVAFPASVSARVFTVREGVPQLSEVQNLCADLPADAALLTTEELETTYQQTARSSCDGVPVGGMANKQLTPANLRRVAATAAAHGRRLYVVFTDPKALPGDVVGTGGWPPVSCVHVSHLNAVLEHTPDSSGADRRTLFLGAVTPAGTLIPARPSRPPLMGC
jgi:4-amino-4-deoxy-L-arabinose transferase-like glycosyltransferase